MLVVTRIAYLSLLIALVVQGAGGNNLQVIDKHQATNSPSKNNTIAQPQTPTVTQLLANQK